MTSANFTKAVCTIYKCSKDKDNKWIPHTYRDVTTQGNTKFLNCVIISEKVILVVTRVYLFLLDENMNRFKAIHIKEIDPGIRKVFSISETHDRSALLLSAHALPDKTRCKSVYQGTKGSEDSWIIKIEFDSDAKEFTLVEPSEDSILVKKETAASITEFARGSMLIAVFNLDLLVTKDWAVIHRISAPDIGNIQKYEHVPLSDFDLDKFPFVLTSGWKQISIVNIATGTIQPLI